MQWNRDVFNIIVSIVWKFVTAAIHVIIDTKPPILNNP